MTHILGVKMYYKGQCKTHIRKEEGTGEHRRTVHYSSTEQYFDYKVDKEDLAHKNIADFDIITQEFSHNHCTCTCILYG